MCKAAESWEGLALNHHQSMKRRPGKACTGPPHTSAMSLSPNCHLKVTTGQLPPGLHGFSAVFPEPTTPTYLPAAPKTNITHQNGRMVSSYHLILHYLCHTGQRHSCIFWCLILVLLILTFMNWPGQLTFVFPHAPEWRRNAAELKSVSQFRRPVHPFW